MSGLDDWADTKGLQPVPLSVTEFMADHPDVAADIIAARNGPAPWPYSVILEWLSDVYGFTPPRTTLRDWVLANG